MGSVRRVWLHFQTEELELPSRPSPYSEISWTIHTYHAINAILGNPVYAGVYAFGKSRQESYLNEHGELKKRVVKLPREKWAVFIQEHHEGFINWQTYQMNRKRIDSNTRPGPQKAGAVREGAALLQGLATCGRCGRRLRVYYQGEKRYRCADPENRLVARTLEGQWEEKLNDLAGAENELAARQGDTPKPLTEQQQKQLH